MSCSQIIDSDFSPPSTLLETRKKTQFYVIASEEDLAHAETSSIRSKLRFRWRKLIKTRIKVVAYAPLVAAE